MAAIPSLSFLGNSCSSSRSLYSLRELSLCPKFPAAKSPPSFLTIQAKAATRRENRTARHSRIRKKGELHCSVVRPLISHDVPHLGWFMF